jgi:DNA-binding transcriptional ArsR family regulator
MANDTYRALAHPARREIVERLGHGPATVGAATRDLGVSKPTISKHLRVLEGAGIVVRRIDGREHELSLNVAPLLAAGAWYERQGAVWARMFDAVDEILAERQTSDERR